MADNTNFQAAAYTARGTAREQVTLPETLFDGTVNVPVMHQAVKAFLANQRQANAHTKIRKYVTGGNQKPWKQKGTGRARQGSTRAPHFVGGGTVFGPTNERNYKQDVPRQVRQLARKSALNARARENAILVIDAFNYDAPRTSRMAALIDSLGLGGRKVLVLTDGVKSTVHLSARNLPTVHVMPYADASTYHILWSDVVLIEGPAIGHTLAPITEAAAEERPSRTAASKTPATSTRAVARAEARTAARTAKKGAKAAKAATAAAPAAKSGKAAPKKRAAAKKTATKAAAKGAAKSAAKKAPAKKSAAKKATKKKER